MAPYVGRAYDTPPRPAFSFNLLAQHILFTFGGEAYVCVGGHRSDLRRGVIGLACVGGVIGLTSK